MKPMYRALYGVLLVLGLASAMPEPVLAGGYVWDTVCNCRRPDHEYNTKRVVREAPSVVLHERVVNHERVVPGQTRLIQENRLIVHVKPVVHKEIVVHRVNTIVKNIELHKVNTTNRTEVVHANQVVNRFEQGETRQILERREVRGVNCNCGPTESRHFDAVSFRN